MRYSSNDEEAKYQNELKADSPVILAERIKQSGPVFVENYIEKCKVGVQKVCINFGIPIEIVQNINSVDDLTELYLEEGITEKQFSQIKIAIKNSPYIKNIRHALELITQEQIYDCIAKALIEKDSKGDLRFTPYLQKLIEKVEQKSNVGETIGQIRPFITSSVQSVVSLYSEELAQIYTVWQVYLERKGMEQSREVDQILWSNPPLEIVNLLLTMGIDFNLLKISIFLEQSVRVNELFGTNFQEGNQFDDLLSQELRDKLDEETYNNNDTFKEILKVNLNSEADLKPERLSGLQKYLFNKYRFRSLISEFRGGVSTQMELLERMMITSYNVDKYQRGKVDSEKVLEIYEENFKEYLNRYAASYINVMTLLANSNQQNAIGDTSDTLLLQTIQIYRNFCSMLEKLPDEFTKVDENGELGKFNSIMNPEKFDAELEILTQFKTLTGRSQISKTHRQKVWEGLREAKQTLENIVEIRNSENQESSVYEVDFLSPNFRTEIVKNVLKAILKLYRPEGTDYDDVVVAQCPAFTQKIMTPTGEINGIDAIYNMYKPLIANIIDKAKLVDLS